MFIYREVVSQVFELSFAIIVWFVNCTKTSLHVIVQNYPFKILVMKNILQTQNTLPFTNKGEPPDACKCFQIKV